MSGDLWVMARNGTTLLPSEVKKLAADYDRIRDYLAAVKGEIALFEAVRSRRNVLVEVSPELLASGSFTKDPLHVMLTDNGDCTFSLTFRESDELRQVHAKLAAVEAERDELRNRLTAIAGLGELRDAIRSAGAAAETEAA